MPYNVLIVEDEGLLRRSLVRKITAFDLGFTVVGDVMDGEAAVRFLEDQLVHLVLTDIRMPVMDGLALAKHLYYTAPQIQVVILSGYGHFDYAQQAIRYGVKEYLTKPIDDDELRRMLRRLQMSLDTYWQDVAAAVQPAAEQSASELAEAVENYLRQNYSTSLSLQSVAQQLNVSPDHLSKVFKRQRGETPMNYLTGLRIREAKHLLLQYPEAGIKEVGQMVGYGDPYYFSRHFKNKVGLSPSEYRAAYHGSAETS